MNANRRFAELCGIEPVIYRHPYTGAPEPEYPKFDSDPRLVLREMMKREDWPEFFHFLIEKGLAVYSLPIFGSERSPYYLSDTLFTDTTGLLRDRAIKFVERGKDEK